jgi:hypothetical protein
MTALGNGFHRLTPAKGFALLNRTTRQMHSEAVTRNPAEFEAVRVEG